MRYYTELIESYLRLHEQASPEAISLATQALKQVENNLAYTASKPYAAKTPSGKIVYLYNVKGKGVKFNPVNNNTMLGKSVAEFPDEFYGYFEVDSGESAAGGGEEPNAGAGIPADGAPVIIPPTPYQLFKKGLLTEKQYNTVKAKVLSSDKCKNRKSAICKEILDGFDKTQDGMEMHGAITLIIANMSEEFYCPEEVDCFKVREEAGISPDKQLLAGVLESAIEILNKDKLTISDVKTLKDTISVDKKGRIMIADPMSGKMMIIKEQVGLMDTIITTLADFKVDPLTGKKLSLKSEDNDFLDKYSAKYKTTAITRGFFYESLRVAAANQIQYNITGDPKYAKLAAAAFGRWLGKSEEVTDALKKMMGQFVRHGGIAIDGNLDDERLMLNTVIEALKVKNPTNFIKEFARTLNRFALAGMVERRPTSISDKAKDVGFGRKGDTKEDYNSFEKADRALEKMGFKDPEMRSSMIKKNGDQYSIFDSLKFSVDLEKIKAGESSAKNQLEVINPEARAMNALAKEQYDSLVKMGVSDSNLESVGAEIKQFNTDYEKINGLKSKSAYVSTASGKVVEIKGREAFIKNVIDMIRVNNDLNDEVTSALQIQLAKIIQSRSQGMGSKGDDWKYIADKVANIIQKKRLELMYGSDKKKAVGIIATLGLFGGASSDNAMLTSADTETGKVFVTNQNVALGRLRTALKDPESANIVFKNSGFLINDIQVEYDGNTATTNIPRSLIEESINNGVGKVIDVHKKEATFASHSNTENKMLKVIEKQYELLETLCHRLIEKDTKVP